MNNEQQEILSKIKAIREKHNFSQDIMADKMNITQSKYARFESGRTKTDLETLINFCNNVNISLKEFFIYPEKLQKNQEEEEEEVKAILQIELKKDKKEQVLKLIFGENNLEILNK